MADGALAQGIAEVVDPEGIFRSALEKIVHFEGRGSHLERIRKAAALAPDAAEA
jgi:hypothetical protein